MASEFGESKTTSFSGNNNNNNPNDAGDFECNICFDLAQDPIVTLCGHLFCWPCLYRWLNHHSHSHECPVCKALIEESKLVPLYGRGKAQSDPRSKSYPGMDDVPRRPAGQRPQTAPPPPHPHQDGNNHFGNFGFGLMGGFGPMATARFGNFTFSTGFGGLSLFPGLFNVQFNGFQDPTAGYGATGGRFPYGVHGFHGGHGHAHGPGVAQQVSRGEQADNALKNLMFLIGFFVIVAMLFFY